jgi:hypothetical protein
MMMKYTIKKIWIICHIIDILKGIPYNSIILFGRYTIMEIWKLVNNTSGKYQISNYGNVKGVKGNLLKPHINNEKYNRVSFYFNKTRPFIHRLVAEHFIPNPENKPFVNHKDFNRMNNHVDNLEWVTAKENVQHSYAEQTVNTCKGIDKPSAKLTETDVINIRNEYNEGVRGCGMKSLAKKYGVCHRTMYKILNRITWKHI